MPISGRPIGVDRKGGTVHAGLTFDDFEASDLIVDAVVHNFEIIGEAARQIPAPILEQYPQSEWSRVVGFRNIVIHAYFAVDVQIV